MRDYLKRLFAHMEWADQRVLQLLRAEPLVRETPALRLFAHVLAAERVWLLRLRGEGSAAQPVWPELDIDEVSTLAAENARAYAELLAGLSDHDLERELAYTTSKGAAFRNRASDILLQVALHGAYHRGQIATATRGAGAEPVVSDYIVFVRES